MQLLSMQTGFQSQMAQSLVCFSSVSTNGGAIALGWDLWNPLPVLYPGPSEAMQTPQASLDLSELLQLLLLVSGAV